MAYDFLTNEQSSKCNDGTYVFYRLKERMKAVGWTVVASGDGDSAYAAGSDVITNMDGGANGFDNTRAWICLQQPPGGSAPYSGTRQFVFQRGDDGVDLGYRWRIVYSRSGTANLGAVNANVVPTFSDEQIVFGGGTPAAPTFDSIIANSTNAAVFHFLVGDVNENFSFMFAGYTNGNSNFNGGAFIFDGITDYTPGDIEPFVLLGSVTTSGGLNNTVTSISTAPFKSWFAAGLGNQAFQTCNALTLMHVPDGLHVNHITQKDDLFDVLYARRGADAAPGGYKGKSHLLKWRSRTRASRDTFTVSASSDRLVLDLLVIPWNGVVPL